MARLERQTRSAPSPPLGGGLGGGGGGGDPLRLHPPPPPPRPPPKGGRGGGPRLRRVDPATLVWAVLIAALVFLVASPMVRLVAASFQDPDTGGFTFANYFEAYGRWRHIEAIVNSIELGTGVALLA